jgi:hypothetical protein
MWSTWSTWWWQGLDLGPLEKSKAFISTYHFTCGIELSHINFTKFQWLNAEKIIAENLIYFQYLLKYLKI